MSKKHKKYFLEETPMAASATESEYRVIRHDLLKVVILNVMYLAVVLAVYFTNQKSHYLERWFEKFFRF